MIRTIRSYFARYLDAMLAGDALAVTGAARDIAAAVLDPPVRLPATGVARLVTAGLLPPRLRVDFGLAWDAARERRLEELCASARALRARSLDASSKAR